MLTRLLAPTLLWVLMGSFAHAKEIITNEVIMKNAPEWLKRTRVEAVTRRIQTKLEWTIRKIEVHWHTSQEAFGRAHSLGPLATAVTVHQGGVSKVHLGPRVTDNLFDEVFAHELVHVIVEQKYKGAIPKWLEEGLANHMSKSSAVDYVWLARQPLPDDVKNLAHPFQGTDDGIVYRYKASQAFAEMLDKKCDLENLIRLSVQRKMENYINTYCGIKDLNVAFRDWVNSKSKTTN